MTFVLTELLVLIQKTRAERQPTDENNVSDYEQIFNSSSIEYLLSKKLGCLNNRQRNGNNNEEGEAIEDIM